MQSQHNKFDPKKILILDFSRIGDTLMHDPLLRALKLKFPKAKLTALTDRPNFDILAHHPAIFEARVFPRIRNFKTLIDYFRKLWWVRRQKFDLLINLYMGGAGASIVRFSKIHQRISFDAKPRFCKTYNILVKTPSSYGNWMIETHEILRPLGIDPASIWPQVHCFITDETREIVAKVLPLKANDQYAAFQLAASEPRKCWDVAKFAELAIKLYKSHHLIPTVITTPDQIEKVDQFLALLPKTIPAVRLPLLRLHQLPAALEKMRILISGDTGVMHMGFGVDIPTLGIFVNRPEYVVSASTNKMVIFHEDETEVKYPSGQLHGTIKIPVTEVYEACATLLKQTD